MLKLAIRLLPGTVVFALLSGPIPVAPNNGQSGMKLVSLKHLCVTKGAIKELAGPKLEVVQPEMRAVVAYPTRQEVEAHFTYLGHTRYDKPLASGEVRRQFGLKLRAQNGCNLVYAMWRIEPRQELVVSVKSNPGQQTSAECGAHGYTNITPDHRAPLPHTEKGFNHTLRAIMEASKLRVFADGDLVWEGDVGPEALAFDGPVGVRTDNGRFKFELFAEKDEHGKATPCHGDQGNE